MVDRGYWPQALTICQKVDDVDEPLKCWMSPDEGCTSILKGPRAKGALLLILRIVIELGSFISNLE